MNAVLITRCDCRKTVQVDRPEPPATITIEMDHMPENWPNPNRVFEFVGHHQVHGYPMYLEALDMIDGKVVKGVFYPPGEEPTDA